MIKYTIEDCKNYAKSKDGYCLSNTFKRMIDPLTWQCKFKHASWVTSFHNIKSNKSWCPTCARNRKYTIEDCKQYAISKNGICTSTEYISVQVKLNWKCNKCNNEWERNFDKIKNIGYFCNKCDNIKMRNKYTIQDCINIAKEKGGKCLTKTYISTKHQLEWQCDKCNYSWFTSFDSIIHSNSWCPNCIGNIKYNINYCHKQAKKYDGGLLSVKYTNISTPLLWKCKIFNHKPFEKDLAHIHRGQWCPECYGKIIILDDCKKLANDRNGECLEDTYINNRTLMQWKCKVCNNIWKNSFSHIKEGQWCPKCNKNDKSESLLRLFLEEYTGKKFPNIRPDFLKNPKTGKNLELDCYCEELKLAFEYQGIQHSKFSPDKFHKKGINVYIDQTERDCIKQNICIDNNIKLIKIVHEFNYRNAKKFKDYIIIILNSLKDTMEIDDEFKVKIEQEMENVTYTDSASDSDYYEDSDYEEELENEYENVTDNEEEYDNEEENVTDNENEYENVTDNDNEEELENEYENVTDNEEKENENKYIFVSKNKYTIEDCKNYAISKNGICTSTEYLGIKKQLNWKCNKCNNEWSRSFDKIRYIGYFCKNCKTDE